MARIVQHGGTAPGSTRLRIASAAALCALCGGAWWAFDEAAQRGPAAGEARVAQPVVQATPAAPEHMAGRPPSPEPGAWTPVGSTVVLDRLEVAPSGAVVALLRVNGGPPSRHLPGDSLGPGIRLSRIDLDRVAIERAGQLEPLSLPPGVAPLRREMLASSLPPGLLAGLPGTATSAVAQLLDSAPGPSVVRASPDRANPPRSGIDRLVAVEALRLSAP